MVIANVIIISNNLINMSKYLAKFL